MAKDPAFLFYPGDWLGGTMAFSRYHKGAYMDLLMAQFNNGHMGLHMVEAILGEKDYADMWEKTLKSKFKQDSEGNFYNQKLEDEILKRRKFTKSRHDNLTKNKTHMVSHMERHMQTHMENENEDVIENKNTDMAKKNLISEIPLPFAGQEFADKWAEWIKYRRERRLSAYVPTGLRRTFNKLLVDSGGDLKTAIEIIEQSLSLGWQGLFPIKTNLNGIHKQDIDKAGKTIEFD